MVFDPHCHDWKPAMRSLAKPIVSLSIFLFLAACTTVQTQSEFQNSIALSRVDNVVLLSNLASDEDFSDKDVDRCIRPAMFDAAPELHFIPAKQFRENLYPYFTPSTTPRDLDDYRKILERAEVQERVASLRRAVFNHTNEGEKQTRIGMAASYAGQGTEEEDVLA